MSCHLWKFKKFTHVQNSSKILAGIRKGNHYWSEFCPITMLSFDDVTNFHFGVHYTHCVSFKHQNTVHSI